MSPPRRQIPGMVRWLAIVPFLAAFFYAPLAFGGTTPETSAYLDWLLLHGFLAWLLVLVCERRRPRLPLVPLVALASLAIIAVLHIINPRSSLDPVFPDFIPNPSHLRWLPGSVDVATTTAQLLHIGALILGGLALFDYLPHAMTRWWFIQTVAWSGFVVAVIGIYQKASGADAMLWTIPERSGYNFFCAYRYHANAASFLNLAWPAAFAIWMRSRLELAGSLRASLDLSVFLVTLAAVFVNSSKAGHVLGLLGFVWIVWRFRSDLFVKSTSRTGALIIGGFVSLVAAILVMPGIVTSFSKWNELAADGGSLMGRLYAYQACLHALSQAGAFGTGAGTFHYVFPFHTYHLGDKVQGFWLHAHQDYLQTLIEWGVLGALAWAVVVFGAFLRLWSRAREARRAGVTEITASIGLLALGLVLLHAMADFPLQIPSLQWLFVFYVALGWSLGASLTAKQEPTGAEAP